MDSSDERDLIAFMEKSGMTCVGVDAAGRLIYAPEPLAEQAAAAMTTGEPIPEAGHLIEDGEDPS
jgi:hypothetical protein